jgi:lipopolysaccharide biosynthesis regulator YciM
MSELGKVAREDKDAVDVLQVLSHLQRETGQVERALQIHQGLLARPDLTRAERAHALASLGADFRKAGFVDRATKAFEEALSFDPNNIYALVGQRKVHEDSRQWREAYEVQTRLSRLRKADDRLILGYLEVLLGDEAREASDREGAERRYRAALALDRRVFPAYLGLADLYLATGPARAASVLEEAQRAAPERAYLALARLERASRALGAPERFTEACERILRQDPRDFRARLALARHLRARGNLQEALGLLLRALEMNRQALVLHVEALDVLRTVGALREEALAYARTVEASVFYLDPHLCTECHYRSDGMLWRCPHCHEWNTFVEERIAPMTVGP